MPVPLAASERGPENNRPAPGRIMRCAKDVESPCACTVRATTDWLRRPGFRSRTIAVIRRLPISAFCGFCATPLHSAMSAFAAMVGMGARTPSSRPRADLDADARSRSELPEDVALARCDADRNHQRATSSSHAHGHQFADEFTASVRERVLGGSYLRHRASLHAVHTRVASGHVRAARSRAK